jgi:hypothetical protein
MSVKPLTVRPVPVTQPGRISADEAYARRAAYTQDALALDFRTAHEDGFERQPTLRSKLDEPAPFVAKIAQAIIEVVGGQRPAPQLIRHTAPAVYSRLARRALVSARRQRSGAQRPAIVRTVRICEPADGIVEASAVVVAHGRVRALALRLEGLDGRWLVTAVTIG